MPEYFPFKVAETTKVTLIALLATLLFQSALAEQPAHPASIEDVLAIEYLGDAQFSNDGRWLVYNLVPPYKELTDYSYWMYSFGLSGHQLWIKNLQRGSEPKLQPGLDRTATNYLFSVSPDSRFVVVLEYKFGELRVVSCEIGKNNCTRYPYELDFRDKYFASARWNERLEWISSSKFILPTRSEFMPGSETRNRALIGQYLWTQWNNAWNGSQATASEVVSANSSKRDDWAQGNLVEFDIEGRKSRILTKGRYAAPRVSPDRRVLLVARVGTRVRPDPDAEPTINETHPLFDRRYAPLVVGIDTNTVQPLTKPYNVDPDSFAWSADGSFFAVFGWESDETVEDGRFYIVNAETLKSSPIDASAYELATNRLGPSPFSELGPARAMLLEDGIAVFARLRGTERFDWYLLDREGRARNLTHELSNVSGNPLYAGRDDIAVLADNGVYRINSDGLRSQLTPNGQDKYRDLYFRSNPDHSWANEFRTKRSRYRWPLPEKYAVAIVGGNNDEIKLDFLDYSAPSQKGASLDLVQGARVIGASYEAEAAVASVKEGASTKLLLIQKGAKVSTLAHCPSSGNLRLQAA